MMKKAIKKIKQINWVKKCPCCNGKPTIRHSIDQDESIAEIECNRCGLKMEAFNDFNSWLAEDVAIKKWNKRPQLLDKKCMKVYDADKIREKEED